MDYYYWLLVMQAWKSDGERPTPLYSYFAGSDQATTHFKDAVNMETQTSKDTPWSRSFFVVASDGMKSFSTDTLIQEHPACDRAVSFVGAERFDVLVDVSATLAETVISTASTAPKPARADQSAKERRTSARLTRVSASATGSSPFYWLIPQ